MPVHQNIPYKDGAFFITFTCYKWLPLLHITNSYDLVYKWFEHLKTKNHKIMGYVIMPNHVHALIDFKDCDQTINTIVGNGKRFMAYDIVKRLETYGYNDILQTLKKNIEVKRSVNNKKHNVWELSFDWKYCNSVNFIKQKLNYMHENPCAGKWNLCSDPVEYEHSSARFYITGENGAYNIEDVVGN